MSDKRSPVLSAENDDPAKASYLCPDVQHTDEIKLKQSTVSRRWAPGSASRGTWTAWSWVLELLGCWSRGWWGQNDNGDGGGRGAGRMRGLAGSRLSSRVENAAAGVLRNDMDL